jgi:predicted ArsR family transcriptional regulator
MKTRMQSTSLIAFKDIVETIGPRQAMVYSTIKKYGEVTDREIGEKLGWEINQVTGRRNELFRLGLIKKTGTRYYQGRPAIRWGLVRLESKLKK